MSPLPACPSSPNCVSTDAQEPRHQIAPMTLVPAATWPALIAVILEFPRTKLLAKTETSAHFECRTPWLGFRDDLHIELRNRDLALRSCSRLGYSDFGANRRRIETLRTRLRAKGLIA